MTKKEELRIRLDLLGYEKVVLDNNEVYVEAEGRMVRLGFLAEVTAMAASVIAYEVEAEITSQEENEEAGWA